MFSIIVELETGERGFNIFKRTSFVGIIGALFAITVWVNFTYLNPYDNPTMAGPLPYPFFLLFLPACLAIYSSLTRNQKWMFVTFLWSVPMSMFMYAMPDISSLFSMISVFYFSSFILIRVKNKQRTV